MSAPRSIRRLQRLLSAAISLCVLAECSCGSSDTALALVVSNIPAGATELRVLAAVDGQAAMSAGSYAPPPAGVSDLRVGVRLVNRSAGQAALDVAACNSVCLLAQNRAQIDLSGGSGDYALALQNQPEALDLRLCAARNSILCSLQFERDAQTGIGAFSLHGSGFSPGAKVYIDGSPVATSPVTSNHRVELSAFALLSKDAWLLEVQNPDTSSIVRRLSIGGLPLDVIPKTIEPSGPPAQADRIPYVTSAVIEDLDRDGNPDIAFVGLYFYSAVGLVPDKPGFLVTYYGDGKRGFVRGDILQNLPGLPRSLSAAQLKGTGQPQLIVSLANTTPILFNVNYIPENPNGGSVAILDPSGPRSYGPLIVAQPMLLGTRSPHQTLVLDVDRDGHRDLVAALSNARSLVGSTSGAILWWRGAGATWQLSNLATDIPMAINIGNTLSPLAMQPWEGPTGTEPGGLAVAAYNSAASRAELHILNNLSAATPATVSMLPLGGTPLQLLAGDFSGDGKRDLLVTLPLANDRRTSQRRVELFTNTANGSAPMALELSQAIGTAVAMDLFADRRDDLVLQTSKDGSAQLAVLPSRTVAPYLTQPTYAVQARGAGAPLLVAGDLDRDGKPDVVSLTTGTLDYTSSFTGQLDVYFGR
ncbi:MAG: hypothetical protein JNJ46_32805 [Myxococcales bacterium]|nr:hypothetical protein [Myxococcales bacterium]